MRLSWQEYFIAIVDATALRASCDRGKSAAVIVRDNRILATGYVGSPSGMLTCDEVGHEYFKKYEISQEEFDKLYHKEYIETKDFSTHCVRTIHSEQNAIINCARNGISTLGAEMYCTMVPCKICAMMIIQAGIKRVVAKNAYQKDKVSRKMFQDVGIELIVLNENLLY
jgi:dCMP deaminase